MAEGGSRAFYQPQRDHVQMPDRGRFATATDWHATRFHEYADLLVMPTSVGESRRSGLIAA